MSLLAAARRRNSGGGPPPFDPLSLNPDLFLALYDTSTLWSNTTATTPATGGGDVRAVRSLDAGAKLLTQTAGGNLLILSGVNGLPAVDLGGSWFNLSPALSISTLFVVAEAQSDVTTSANAYVRAGTSSNRIMASDAAGHFMGGSGSTQSFPDSRTGVQMYAARRNGISTEWWRNGLSTGSITTVATLVDGTRFLGGAGYASVLGAWTSPLSNGDIGNLFAHYSALLGIALE